MANSASIIVNAVASLAACDPGILRIWANIKPVQDDTLNVAYKMVANGDHIDFRYNGRLLPTIGKRMVARLVYMECLRILLGHIDSRAKPDMAICKMASDIVTGSMTMRKFPEETGELHDIVSLIPTYAKYETILAKHGIEFPIRKFNLEDIYDALLEEYNDVVSESCDDSADDCQDDVQPDDGTDGSDDNVQPGDSSDDGPDCQGAAMDGTSNDNDDVRDGDGGETGDMDAGETGDDAGPDDHGDGTVNDENGHAEADTQDTDAVRRIVSSLFSYTPGDGDWEGTDELDGNMSLTVKELVSDGTLLEMVGANLYGSVAGRYDNIVKTMANTFRKFTASISSVETDETWRRPNRRYDDEMPGERRVCRPYVLLAVDISGSMDINVVCVIDMLKVMLRAFDLDVCFWNERTTLPVHAKLTGVTVPPSEGGTNPEAVMEMVRERRLRYDGYVFITDCEFEWEQPPEWKRIAIIRVANGLNPLKRDEFPEWCRYPVDDNEVNI